MDSKIGHRVICKLPRSTGGLDTRSAEVILESDRDSVQMTEPAVVPLTVVCHLGLLLGNVLAFCDGHIEAI